MSRKKNKLTCPYSGSEMSVVFDPDLRNPGWMAVGGFDPSLPFFLESEAEAAFRRRAGKGGDAETPACAYSGKPVSFVTRNNLWYATGWSFNPYQITQRREELEYACRGRNGFTPGPKPKPVLHVQSVVVLDEQSDPTEGLGSRPNPDRIKELLK